MKAEVVLTSSEIEAIDALDSTIKAKGSVPQDKKSFAAMNGVTVEFELESEEYSRESEIPPEPEEIVTTRVISQHPLLKAAVIGSGIFLVVAVAGGMINASMNALTNSPTVKAQPIKQAAALDKEETQSENPGKIKTALAITSQKPELESLRNLSKPTSKAQEANTTAQKSKSPSSSRSSITNPPTAATRQQQYTPVPQGQPISVRKNPTSQPVISREAVSSKSFFTPSLRLQPQSIALGSSVSNKPAIDPQQQWLAVSNIGSFSANSSTDSRIDESINTEGLSGGTGTPKSGTIGATNVSKVFSGNSSKNVDYNARRVIVGTRTQGKIETPIAISASNINQVQKYLIRLTKPLKASDGSEVLPVDSYLVVVPNGSSSSEYIQMSAVSALINVGGQTLEKTIAENSIIILNKNGEALKAQSQKGSNLGSDFMTAIIAGVSKAAEVENNPSSQTTISSNGYSTSTSSNDDKNLLAGFAQGSFSQILQSIQSSNQQKIQSLQSESRVFVIPVNTTVQIFVNQTVSL